MIAFIVATPAFAADIPVWSKTNEPARYLPVTASRPYSWTGCYLGLEGGGAWGQSQHSAASPPMVDLPITQDFNVGSGIFGGTIGCNYQTGDTAFGVENDLSWTNVKGTGNDILPFAVGGTSSTNEKWLDTLRGRIGYARDRIFVYGTGGAAFANVGVEVCVPTGFCASDSQTRTGWVVGAGAEWAALVDERWSMTLKVEYLHTDLGTGQFLNPAVATPTGGTLITRNVRLTNDIVRAGVNLKFNTWGLPTLDY